jgi:hypothetical protein
MSLTTPEQVIAQIRAIIARRVQQPSGALFTFVLRHATKETFTLGGRIRFSDQPANARASIRHPKLSLLEE